MNNVTSIFCEASPSILPSPEPGALTFDPPTLPQNTTGLNCTIYGVGFSTGLQTFSFPGVSGTVTVLDDNTISFSLNTFSPGSYTWSITDNNNNVSNGIMTVV